MVSFDEKILMEGMSDKPAGSLISLARSWLKAPSVTSVSGGASNGYNQSHRAYSFTIGSKPLSFQINASERNPIHNLCFEIRNCKSRSSVAEVTINGVSQVPGPDFRQGINIDTDGSYTMIIWLGLTAKSVQNFGININ